MGLLNDKRSAKQQPDEDLWEGLFGEEKLEAPVEPEAAPDEKKGRVKREKRQKQPSKRESRRAARQASVAAEAKEPKRGRAKGKGLSLAQTLILLLLGIFIIVAYLILASMIGRTLPTTSSGNETAVPPTDVAATAAVDSATPRPAPPTATRIPSPTRTPVPTPTPAPLVSTQFDQHINAEPDNIELRLQRGAEYLKMRAYTLALSDYEHAQSLDEKRAEAYIGIGEARYHLLEWPEAENAFLTAISFKEDLPEPYFGIGMLYYLQGRYSEAAKEFDHAAERNPTLFEAEAWLAIASAQAGDVEEAMGAAGRAISLTQDSAIVHIARSWAYRVQNPPNIDAAQSDLLYAQKLDPYNFELLVALAFFYTDYRPERVIEAELSSNYALQWARNDLERARALGTLGHVYLAQNRKDEAKKVLIEAADLTTYEGQVLLFGVIEDLNQALAP